MNPHRDLQIGTAIIVAGLLAVVAANGLLSLFQPLYLLNATRAATHLKVDSRSVELAPGGMARVYVSEGKHVVSVRLDGEGLPETTIEVRNGFFERYSLKNVFVFNVLGAQALAVEDFVYSSHGDDHGGRPPALLLGRSFYSFHDINYPFEPPPKSISLDNGSSKEIRTALSKVDIAPENIVSTARSRPESFTRTEVQGYAEGNLRGGNRSPELIEEYWAFCVQAACERDARELLLKLGLPRPGVEERGAAAAEAP